MPNDTNASDDAIQSTITVTATPVMGARVQVITPGTFTAGAIGAEVTATAIDLPVGTDTLITVTVVAADGMTQQAYTVTVTRAASDDATLATLTLSEGSNGTAITLDPPFNAQDDPRPTSYKASVGQRPRFQHRRRSESGHHRGDGDGECES